MTAEMSRLGRRGFLGLAGGAMLWPVIGRAAPVEGIGGPAFGTQWRMAGPGLGSDLGEAVATLFAGIDAQMSPWRSDSMLSGLNRAGVGAQEVPEETALVTAAALALTGESGGAFDPGVGPLVARWGFGPIDVGEVSDASAWTVEGTRVVKRDAGATLDLCGIAKGWALDEARALAARQGHRDVLIDLGGELAALGMHPEGRPWKVGVENPLGEGLAAVLSLAPGLSVATSGRRAQSYVLGGRSYSHIIDPATGEPVAGALASVSVLSERAMTADGWATALFAAGAERGVALAEAHGIDALFLSDDGGALRQQVTGRMAEVLA
ncbi:FAD:protein FMN transferase [Allosediminivita pacifica]|uniref:FAD:protein FMN transferase n=1 Tax=Allosediminivita pacifica TaxID=1267769 RepID=A0A2T6ANJ0_9RHOB|nr:FAD:protein FMN transferase [Allosediminivita pacifica]PTX45394.1 thiamine biosynthesis lipoprotein [Allosediminivita pacifica]GGB20953.1 FAD:protein FMN transferase [Allosediminivita pacifica]